MFAQTPSSQAYVEQLWLDGRRSYSDLTISEIDKLTGFLMREAASTDQKWHYEFVSDAKNLSEIANKLATLLINPDSKSAADNFLVAARNGATGYAQSFIDGLFENRHYYRRAA